MLQNRVWRKMAEYLAIVLLALVSAMNYQVFVFPNSFAPAGLDGLATMVQHMLHINVGYMSLLVNAPLFIAAFFVLNRDYTFKSLCFVLIFSGWLIALERIDLSMLIYQTDNGTSTILAPVAAGVINGMVYGCIIRLNGSKGGIDIIAALVRIKHPEFNLMWIIFSLNCIVAGISYFVYGLRIEPVILCVIYSFVSTNVADRILQKVREAIKFEIITDRAEELSADVITHLHHSATRVSAEGMYHHQGMDMLICVVNKHQIIEFQQMLKKYPGTFAYISPVSQTIGNFRRAKHEMATEKIVRNRVS